MHDQGRKSQGKRDILMIRRVFEGVPLAQASLLTSDRAVNISRMG